MNAMSCNSPSINTSLGRRIAAVVHLTVNFVVARAAAVLALSMAMLFPLCCGSPGAAQVVVQQGNPLAPVVLRLEPPVIVSGAETEVTFAGANLTGANAVLATPEFVLQRGTESPDTLESLAVISKGEVTAEAARLTIRVSAETPAGPYLIHVLADGGISNPRILWIAPRETSISAEQEPNDELAQASLLETPGIAWGALRRQEFDHFRFHISAEVLAAAEERPWCIEALAGRLGSPLRPVLTLHDASGRELASDQVPSAGIAPDMRLVVRFPGPGDYSVRLNDRTYLGDPNAVYALRIAPAEFAESMFPLGGRVGEAALLEFAGEGLTGPTSLDADLSPGRAPLGLTNSFPFSTLRLARQATSGETLLAPAFFAAGELPELTEQEPNDSASAAMPLPMAHVINGRMDAPHDVDLFRFTAVTGQRLRFELAAAALGSPLDGVLTVRNADDRIVANGDDRPDDSENPPIVRPAIASRTQDDPILEFAAPADGEYVLAVEDRYGFGGPRYAYRLTVDQPREQLALQVQPAPQPSGQGAGLQAYNEFFGQNGSAALSLDRGGRGMLVVQALRRGFNGAIELQVTGLPEGVTATPAVIPPGQNQGVILLSAGFDAPQGARFVEVTAKATIAGTERTLPALQPVYLSALASYEPVKRVLPFVAVGVSGQAAELAIQTDAKLTAAPGESAQLHVRVYRREGLAGAVTLQPIGTRDGIQLEPLTIAGDANEATLPVTLSADLPPGNRTLEFTATMAVEGRPLPIVATASTNLEVSPMVSMELLTPQLDIAVGQSSELKFRLTRRSGNSGRISFSISGLPGGLSVADADREIAADAAGEITIPVSAAADSTPSAIRRFVRLEPTLETSSGPVKLPTLRCAVRIVAGN